MNIAPGEALFIGIWYITILSIAIAVWIIAIELVRISITLSGIRQWCSGIAITQAAQGVVPDAQRRDVPPRG